MEKSDEEFIRMQVIKLINSNPKTKEELEEEFGKNNVWDTQQLQEEFKVIGFCAPFCAVKRKSTNEEGSVLFQHMPRFYFDFQKV